MKNTILPLFSLGFVLAASSAAFGAQVGPAGCGLGFNVMGKDNQVLAATTNGTSGNQTFGISSGTSGCEQHGSMAQMIMFIEANRVALSNDAARGQGETITALSSLLGCDDSSEVSATLRANYPEIFGAHPNDSVKISETIRDTVKRSRSLARSCQSLG